MTNSKKGKWRVLLTEPIDEAGTDTLGARPDIEVELLDKPDRALALERFPKADAIIVRMMRLDAELLDAAANLKVVARHGVGYDTVDVKALSRRSIPLAIAGDVNAVSVAEHTLCLILGLAKHIRDYDAAARRADFAYRLTASSIELYDKTLLILGFGRIGQEVARRALAFGMTVAVHDPLVAEAEITGLGCVAAKSFHGALESADFVSLHAPLVAETRNIMNREAFARMKPTAFVINTARGGEIDEQALYEALKSNRIAGAGLDVFADYPPAADNPLLGLENVLVTPHSAGLTRECAERIAVACARNVLDAKDRVLDSELVVNKDVLRERRVLERSGSSRA